MDFCTLRDRRMRKIKLLNKISTVVLKHVVFDEEWIEQGE
jgi:hypothetical protein